MDGGSSAWERFSTSWNHKFTILLHSASPKKPVTTPLWWMMVSANVERSFREKKTDFLVRRGTYAASEDTGPCRVPNNLTWDLNTSQWWWRLLGNQTRKSSNNIPVMSRDVSHSGVKSNFSGFTGNSDFTQNQSVNKLVLSEDSANHWLVHVFVLCSTPESEATFSCWHNGKDAF